MTFHSIRHLSAILPAVLLCAPLAAQTELATGEQYIVGELCVGGDCDGTEDYPLHLLILKSTQPSLKFEDTSLSPFPRADWAIEVSGNFPERLSFVNFDGFTTPFQIEAQSPSNALYLDANGEVGIGTSMPQSELHIVGDTVAGIRLDSFNAGTQSWLVLGTNNVFAITDFTNGGSQFGIETGGPPASIYVDDAGFVGLGTSSPQEKLHIRTTADNADAFALFDATGSGSDAAFRLRQGTTNTTWEFRNQADSGRLNVGLAGGNTPFKIDNRANNNLLRLGRNGLPGEVNITGTLVVNNTQLNVPDYVFADDYALRPLAEVRTFIDTNSHLPDVPSEAEIKANGVDMTAMQMVHLKKIEELTLYTLEQQDEIANQNSRLLSQAGEIGTLKDRLARIEALLAE